MTTIDATAPVARYVDVLPLRGGKRIALEWMPPAEPGAPGFVILTSARDRTTYSVTRHPGTGPLLEFVFSKIGGKGTGTGKREWHVLSCTRMGNDAKCTCESWEYGRGYCKHSDTLSSLFANRWLTG